MSTPPFIPTGPLPSFVRVESQIEVFAAVEGVIKAARGRAALQSADAPNISQAQPALECAASAQRFDHALDDSPTSDFASGAPVTSVHPSGFASL